MQQSFSSVAPLLSTNALSYKEYRTLKFQHFCSPPSSSKPIFRLLELASISLFLSDGVFMNLFQFNIKGINCYLQGKNLQKCTPLRH